MARGVLCPKCATVATATAPVCPKCGTRLGAEGSEVEDSTAMSKKPRPQRTTDKVALIGSAVKLQDGGAASSTAPFKAFTGDATVTDSDENLASDQLNTMDDPNVLKTSELLALQPKPEPPKPVSPPRRGTNSGLRAVAPEPPAKRVGALATHQAAAAAAAAAPPPPRKDPLIGEKLGEYLIEEKIGTGGMGVVYRASQPQIGGTVAIKILRGDVIADKRDMERLLDEARVVNAIKHRGIINIFGAGELADGRQYLVMEYLEGETLEKRLERVGTFTTAQALPILDEVLAALAAAHETGIVHRDLKPANVFLVKQSDGPDLVKLLDFGLARRQMAEVSRIAGTPDYISPEHARGRPAGPPADLYGFGILAFHMLTGQLPFKGNTPMEMMEKHVHSAPPVPAVVNPDISAPVSGLILALLEKDPSKRPDAAQAKLDLKAALKQLQKAAETAEQPVGATPKDGMAAMSTTSSAEIDPRLKVLARKADLAKIVGQLAHNWPWVAAGLGLLWLLGVMLWMSFSSPPGTVIHKAPPTPLKKPPPGPPVPVKAVVEPPKPAVVDPRPAEPVPPPAVAPEVAVPAPPEKIEPPRAHAEGSIAAWRRKTMSDLALLDVELSGELEAYRPGLNTLRDDVQKVSTPEQQEEAVARINALKAKVARAAQ